MNRSVNVRSGNDNRVPTVSSETVASGLRGESTIDVVGRDSRVAKGSEDESSPVRAFDVDCDGTSASTFFLLLFLRAIGGGRQSWRRRVVCFTLFGASQRSSTKARAHHLVQQSQSRACSHRNCKYRLLTIVDDESTPSSLPAALESPCDRVFPMQEAGENFA